MKQNPPDLLHLAFLEAARANWGRLALADTTGRELSFGRSLTAGVLLADWVARECEEDEMVGVMLPASVGGALSNIGILMAGKVVVNLNFTAGSDDLTYAIEQCRIRKILTSRRFLTKAKLPERPGMVFLEDLLTQFGFVSKLGAMLKVRLSSLDSLRQRYSHDLTEDSLATVVFSSGSTGKPKGVMLSHKNLLSNIRSAASLFPLKSGDTVAGILPFFHSFGFTFTLWFPLVCGYSAAFHPNPMEAQAVGEMIAKYRATFLLATPTFCLSFARKIPASQFASLRFILVGAEKLREPVAQAFRDKFGTELLEGYGCTEMAPVVAVNRPADPDGNSRNRPGTVGMPIPGVKAKVVAIETGEDLGPGEEGLILVTGPNRMAGYLGDPKRTEEVILEDWYITGDIGSLDQDGFLRLTDRLARFSKIGGEMVPHARVEEVLESFFENRQAVVAGVPDPHKGERLVVLYTGEPIDAKSVTTRIAHQSDLPNLWVPKPADFYPIADIPVLGTGKLDLQAIKKIAREKANRPEPHLTAYATEPQTGLVL